MRKSVTAILAGLLLAASLPAVANAATTKAAVKVGAKCTKSGATAKVGSTNLVCKRNAKKVLVWTKIVESQACKEAKATYLNQKKAYDDIVLKIADAKKAAATLSGSAVEALKAQIAATEASLPSLKSLVDQLADLTNETCKLGG